MAGTTDHGIWYSKITNFTLIGFTDSDYAGNVGDRKSTFMEFKEVGIGGLVNFKG